MNEQLVGLDLDIREVFEEELPCSIPEHENPQFEVQRRNHAGPGEWYVTSRCPSCDRSKTHLVCTPFKDAMMANLDHKLGCAKCRKYHTVGSMVSVLEK